MSVLSTFIVIVVSAAPSVEVTTLSGDHHVGTLDRYSAEEVVLTTPTGSQTIPGKELLKIRMAGNQSPGPSATPLIEIRLTDGTLLQSTSFTSTTKQITVNHSQLASLNLPLTSVQTVRFAPPDSKVDAAWSQLVERVPKKDQVAIRKNDLLDHLDGVIGSLDESTLKFQLDGDDIPVKRERIFGLIFSKRDSTVAKSVAAVELVSGDRLAASSMRWEQDSWKVKLASGSEISVPATSVQSVDFSLGKIAYLSNLEPRSYENIPYFDYKWPYYRDRSLSMHGHGSHQIRVGNKSYSKGIAIHSSSVLKYRIGGDYRRFQTIMGIDDDFLVGGNVDVTIKGDNRTLFKGIVKIGQPPQPLDLDVTGVVELQIAVGFGEDRIDIGDDLDLADAKLIK